MWAPLQAGAQSRVLCTRRAKCRSDTLWEGRAAPAPCAAPRLPRRECPLAPAGRLGAARSCARPPPRRRAGAAPSRSGETPLSTARLRRASACPAWQRRAAGGARSPPPTAGRAERGTQGWDRRHPRERRARCPSGQTARSPRTPCPGRLSLGWGSQIWWGVEEAGDENRANRKCGDTAEQHGRAARVALTRESANSLASGGERSRTEDAGEFGCGVGIALDGRRPGEHAREEGRGGQECDVAEDTHGALCGFGRARRLRLFSHRKQWRGAGGRFTGGSRQLAPSPSSL